MEIHELNTFSGTPGSGDYLATDNGNDTSKIPITDITGPLNTRINNIIAGGDAPSEAEIVDARLGADGVTYPSLGDAIRSQVSDLKSEITQLDDVLDDSFINTSTNLIDNRSLIGRTPADAFGLEGSTYVAYIPLIWGENTAEGSFNGFFVLNDGSSDRTDLNAIVLAFCDEDKTALGGDVAMPNFNSATLNVPSTAKYLRLTMYSWRSYPIVKIGVCKSTYEMFSGIRVSERLNTIEAVDEEQTKILSDISKKTLTGSYFDFSPYIGKTLCGSGCMFAGANTTLDIDVSELNLIGKSVGLFLWLSTISGFVGGYITQSQLDADGNQIYPTSGYHYIGLPMTILDGCKTIRLYATTNAYDNWGSLTVEHAQLYTDGNSQVDYVETYVPNTKSSWNGKKWVSYGDSITQQGRWQPYVISQFGFTHINAGIGGSAVADGNDQGIASFTNSTRISALPSDADVVTIMGGTNDFNGTNGATGSPIGSLPLSTPFDTTEFMGALCQTVKLIQEQCPDAFIVLMSNVGGRGTSGQAGTVPLKNAKGFSSMDYADATKEVADYLGVPFVDVHGCGINPYNRVSFISDSVHPNAKGAELIARKVVDFFANNYPLS